MKKAWVYLVSVHAVINQIWLKYRIKYNLECLQAAREYNYAKIKGAFKFAMKRFYAQHAE